MVFGVVSYAQEKPQDAEKHVCTEQCDHSAKSEMMACCKAAAAEGKACGKCDSKKGDAKQTAMVEKKSCGKEAAGKSCCAKAGTK